MLILTSPSKTLDLTSSYPDSFHSLPEFLDQTLTIHNVLFKKSRKELAGILDVSEKIAEENYQRYQKWASDHNIINSRPAIYTFAGNIYQEMHPKKYNKAEREYAQQSLRIISGFYGLLRPYDLIQPYRLEMHTSLHIAKSRNLYQYWIATLTHHLKSECENKSIILNLASEEYIRAIDTRHIQIPIVKVEFRKDRGGKLASYGVVLKRARGMMIEYCIKNKISDINDLKKFNTAGYKFIHEDRHGTLTFVQTN